MSEPVSAEVATAVRLVAAYVANNAITQTALPDLLRSTHAAILALNAPPAPAVDVKALSPAVPVNKSVFPEHLVCLDCGQKFKSLKRHLRAEHGLSPQDYRNRWGLPDSYRIVAPAYRERRSELAKASGLGTTGRG